MPSSSTFRPVKPLTIPSQTILQALQSQPPRPPPQRLLQIKAIRRCQRSLLHPRLRRKAQNLRPRLPALHAILLRPRQQRFQRPPRLLLLPQHARRRPPSLRSQQETYTVQRPAALVLPLRRLRRAEREALAARAERAGWDVRSPYRPGDGTRWFYAWHG
jgi:hypothetical protein